MSSELRLHPLTILFEIGASLRQFAIPIVVLLFVGRTRSGEMNLVPALAVIVLGTLGALARYFAFRYRYGATELVVRSGFLVKNERHIPYDRIQNIDAVQNLAHRAMGVVSVQVQTGAGTAPEATLSVLPLSAVAEMRARVFGNRVASAPSAIAPAGTEAGAPGAVAAHPGRTLLHLSTDELLLAGFIENRGMVLVLGALGVITQVDPLLEAIQQRLAEWIPGIDWSALSASSLTDGRIILGIVAVVLALLFFVRLLSSVWAAVRLHDFRLTRAGDDLRVEYGLLTRVTATIPLRRVQTIAVHETLVHRMLGRAAVRVSTAGGGTGEAGRAEREWIAPIVERERMDALLGELQPGIDLAAIRWRGAHPRAFRRIATWSSFVALVLATVTAPFIELWAVPVALLLIARAIVRARVYVRNLGWGEVSEGVIVRAGWLRRITTFARYSRVQVVSVDESPLDRRAGMADVSVDTAAAGLVVPYLSRPDAVELRTLVGKRAEATAFTW
jgi:putative membrane protein